MGDSRSGRDRRVSADRRKGGTSSYSGPEKRAIKYRRSDKERRGKA
jgi:hypothetical protein